jgi:hypothetical protein
LWIGDEVVIGFIVRAAGSDEEECKNRLGGMK